MGLDPSKPFEPKTAEESMFALWKSGATAIDVLQQPNPIAAALLAMDLEFLA